MKVILAAGNGDSVIMVPAVRGEESVEGEAAQVVHWVFFTLVDDEILRFGSQDGTG